MWKMSFDWETDFSTPEDAEQVAAFLYRLEKSTIDWANVGPVDGGESLSDEPGYSESLMPWRH